MTVILQRSLFAEGFNDYLAHRLQKSAEWRLCLDEHYLPGADDQEHSDTGFVYYTYTMDRDWHMINSQDLARGYFNNLAETMLNTALAGTDMKNPQIMRIMWNYYNRASTGIMHRDHQDQGIYSMVYNLSQTDGGTEIDGKFYAGDSGTALIFPSCLDHRGFGPRIEPRRFVLNCIFSAELSDK
jgi:hypothetical protein